jgi:hypothetical protein
MYIIKIRVRDLTDNQSHTIKVTELDEWGSITLNGTLYDFHAYIEDSIPLSISICELKDGEGGLRTCTDISYDAIIDDVKQPDNGELIQHPENGSYYLNDVSFENN